MNLNGLYRLAAAVPQLKLGVPSENAKRIAALYQDAAKKQTAVIAFPELCLTGATCGGLFRRPCLLEAALKALRDLADETRGCQTAMVVGLPLAVRQSLFNCAAVLQNGKIAGICAKLLGSHSAPSADALEMIDIDGEAVPFKSCPVFESSGLTFGLTLGDDLLGFSQASCEAAIRSGAQAILNISAIPVQAGTSAERKSQALALSRRLKAVYLTANAGVFESTDSLVYGGQALIASEGRLLAANEGLEREAVCLYADVFPAWIDYLHTRVSACPLPASTILLEDMPEAGTPDFLTLPRMPFAPDTPQEQAKYCDQLLDIQAAGLARRITCTGSRRMVLGVSGGLDSTLALLVCKRCCDLLGLPPTTILAITMPGMGTSGRTRSNAEKLAEAIGTDLREIPIKAAVLQHFKDISHAPDNTNVVYENAQARERTQILMDVANEVNGLVIGTGDLSEIALGWCTFNGDHMSMYSVNGSVPKSLIRLVVDHVAATSPAELAAPLRDINATPVSPELLPGAQHTEAIIGNYDLHDFFLYYFVKYGVEPADLRALACHAFKGIYSSRKITETLSLFTRRFFTQQFKRNVMPDGPKATELSLSPAADWQAPSDLSFDEWKNQL